MWTKIVPETSGEKEKSGEGGLREGSEKEKKTEQERLREELQELLISMELQHMQKTPEEFFRWWKTEGGEREYFSKKRRLEMLEEEKMRERLLCDYWKEEQGADQEKNKGMDQGVGEA